MKRLILLLPLILASCSSPFIINTKGYAVQEMDLDTAWKHVASFEYQSENESYWKSPVEFEKDGGGDCEDFAVDLVYLLGKEASLYVVKLNGYECYHAIVFYDGKYIEPQIYGMYYNDNEFMVSWHMDYMETMNAVTLMGAKRIR